MSKFISTTLRNKINIKHGFSFKGEFFVSDGKYIVLTPGNFYESGGFKFNIDKAKFYNGKIPQGYICAKGDLIVAMTEQAEGLLGSSALVPEDDKFLHNQRIGLVTVDEKLIDKSYLYHLFNTKSVRQQLRSSSSGSKVKHTSPDRIYDVVVNIPSLDIQRDIAATLTVLDSKIEVAQRISMELDQIAKITYDYWFMQFDFPNENGKPYKHSGGKMVWNKELGREIPMGWSVDELGNNIEIKRGVSYASSDLNDSGIPMVNLNSFYLNGSYKPDGIKFLNDTFKSNNRVKAGELIVAATDVTRNADITGKSFILPDLYNTEVVVSADTFQITVGNKLDKHFLNMLFNSKDYHNYIKGYASGTLVLHLNPDGIKWYKIVIPPKDLQIKYSQIKHKIEEKKTLIFKEILKLLELRNWLKPMLMNGQVTISRAADEFGKEALITYKN